MADEEKKEGNTSNDALSQAQDKANAEVKATEEETPTEKTESTEEVVEQQPWEKEIHKLKSEQGRKDKRYETEIAELKEKINYSTYSTQPVTPTEERYVSNEADLDKWYERKKSEETKVISDYDKKYLAYLDKVALEEELEDAEVQEVSKLLVQPEFKKAFSNYSDPISDADRNFNRALAKVRKSTSPKTNLKGDTPKGTGVNVNTQMQEKETPIPKLDKDAQDFVERTGMKKEAIAKALNGETPMRLKK